MKEDRSIRYAFYCLIYLLIIYSFFLGTRDEHDLPRLKNGDLIFQTTFVPGATAIGLASASWYIHTGIIASNNGNPTVIHAGRTVTETPLSEWVDQGVLRRFAVYRYQKLSPEKRKAIVTNAKSYIGKPYDHYFSFDNDTIYCSELEYLAYKKADIEIGMVQKIGSLHINNSFVKSLIEERWQQYPACQNKGFNFEQCYKVIMSGELITPSSIAHDKRTRRIFTNYPW